MKATTTLTAYEPTGEPVEVTCDCGETHPAFLDGDMLTWRCPKTGELFVEADA